MVDTEFYAPGLMDLSNYHLSEVQDKAVWDRFTEQSGQGTVFNLSCFTDSFQAEIINLGLYKGDELYGAISLDNSDDGVGRRHPLVIYNGPMLRKLDSQQAAGNQFSEQFRTIAAMTKALVEKYQIIEFQTHYTFADTRPFEWHSYATEQSKFQFYPRHTSIVELASSLGFEEQQTESLLYKRCSKSRRQEIRYALDKGVKVAAKFDLDIFVELYRSTFTRQAIQVDNAYLEKMIASCRTLYESGNLVMYIATDNAGRVGSIAIFGLDSKRAYYLYGANSEVARNGHTGSLVLFHAFFDLLKRGVGEVDLEGINSPARGHFKMSFGGCMRSYFSVNYESE